MSNLDVRICEMRKQLEQLYHLGDKTASLEVSKRLDLLIALALREKNRGETTCGPEEDIKKVSAPADPES